MTEPIPLTIQCTVCGHPTMKFLYRRDSQDLGMLWWKHTIPPSFRYHCLTCSVFRGFTREALGGHFEVRDKIASGREG